MMETQNKIYLYNTLSHKVEEFKPLKEKCVSIYVCGPTVYDYIHIGNARPLVVFDVLRRLFIHDGYDVKFAMNITDIDDKIIRKANKEQIGFEKVAERYIDTYIHDRKSLNVMDPDFSPRASESLKQIKDMIQGLIDQGYAYIGEEGVYFDVSKHSNYGKLAKLNQETLQSGTRELAYQASDKKHSADFALWKFRRGNEPYFEAEFGEGRPGWHIECSAMIEDIFSGPIDIHAGGQDLIFPHHENEIAQTECCHHHNLAYYWLHNAYITIVSNDGSENKMSKSLGNFKLVHEIGKNYGYNVLRFFILTAQYRSNLKFYPGALDEAKTALARLQEASKRMKFLLEKNEFSESIADEGKLLEEIKLYVERFFAALRDDLNTPQAIAEIFQLVKLFNLTDSSNGLDGNICRSFMDNMNLCLETLGVVLFEKEDLAIPEEVLELLNQRQEARKNRDYARADQLRDKILSMNYLIKDTPQGAQLERINE